MVEITLQNKSWFYDPESPLGETGGFGRVFLGRSTDSEEVAIKELLIEAQQGAHREMRMADFLADAQYDHVIPIYDSGFDEQSGRYFVVMAKADRSLQDELETSGVLDDRACGEILLQIARGLAEVARITHRDLKPANVLWHEARWKIADFGIARFVEESTSSQTLKEFLTPEYAAPEQWRGERADTRTDIYSLGCIGFASLLGHPPFEGPEAEDFRRQHLEVCPPSLEGHDTQLRTLLATMVRKETNARPGIERVIRQLEKLAVQGIRIKPARELDALRDAGAQDAEKAAKEEASASAWKQEGQRRARMAKQAAEVFDDVMRRLFKQIREDAPTASSDSSLPYDGEKGHIWKHVRLAEGVLTVRTDPHRRPFSPGCFGRSGWDVILGGRIEVVQLTPRYEWSASLWYTNLRSQVNHRWFEVSYYQNLAHKRSPRFEPHALTPGEADAAAASSMDSHDIAFGPRPVDDEDAEDFVSRWAERLGLAAQGKLTSPRFLPLECHAPSLAQRQW